MTWINVALAPVRGKRDGSAIAAVSRGSIAGVRAALIAGVSTVTRVIPQRGRTTLITAF
jgi:hypothetical protein